MAQFLLQQYANGDLTDLAATIYVDTISYSASSPQSARFSAYIQYSYAETYTISVLVNDGTRVWLNGVLKVDEWHDSPGSNYTFQVTSAAGQIDALEVEYENTIGSGSINVYYSSASQPMINIPAAITLLNPPSHSPILCTATNGGSGETTATGHVTDSSSSSSSYEANGQGYGPANVAYGQTAQVCKRC